MSCNSCHSTCQPCTCVPYVDTGCLDTYNTDCVKYTGDDISCLQIVSGDTLTDIIGHLEDVVCALSPTTWSAYDYGCLSTLNITTQQEFAEGIAATICDMQTDITTNTTNITTLTTSLNTVKTVTTLDCFETISGLPGPTATSTSMFAAIQQILCDHESEITALQALGGVALTATDSATIDFTTSGTGGHTLTGSVKISATANNSVTAESDGIYVEEVPIVVQDTTTIDFTASGTLNHTITADVKISNDPNNRLIDDGTGLFVAGASFSETSLTANDSNSIDFTTSGISNHTVTASVKLDPAVDNIITITSDGLYANATSFAISSNSIGNTQLRDSGAYSVIGRASGSTGDPADITAGTDSVLRRTGSGNVAFGTLSTNHIGDDQVTFSKMQNVSTQKVLGRSTAATGDIEQLSIGSNLAITGGTLNTVGRTLIGVTKFTSSGTWTKPTGCNAIEVIVVGAGGGGAGSSSDTAEAAVGGAGGAGGFARYFFTSLFGSSETVTVGAGGAGGDSGTAYDGEDGGDSSFGTIASASGGDGGLTLASGTAIGLSGIGPGGNSTLPAGNMSLTGYLYGSEGATGISGVRLSATEVIVPASSPSALGSGGAGSGAPGAGGKGNGTVGLGTIDGIAGNNGIVIVYEYS